MTSPGRAEHRRGSRVAAKRANAARALENPLHVQREYLQALERLTYASDSALPKKLPTWLPLVQRTIANWVRDTGLVEPAEAELRSHPGKPSEVTTEPLLKAMMLANWKEFTYQRTDLLAALAALPDDILDAYGLVDAKGRLRLPKSPTFDKQLRRLEDLICAGKDPVTGAGLDQAEVETRMITASLPLGLCIWNVSIDATPFESWYLPKIFITEEEAKESTRERYQKLYDPDAAEPVPGMGTALMRELAEQIGIPIGPDGKIERSVISPDDRTGFRNGTGKRPEGLYLGYAVIFVTAVRPHYWAGKHDKVKLYDAPRSYILFVRTASANANLADLGLEGLLEAKRLEPTIKHAFTDQGFSRVEAFPVGARKAGVEPHMNYPKPQLSRPPKPVYLDNTGSSGTAERVLEHLGAFYHEWMPTPLRAPKAGCTRDELAELAAKRLRWAYEIKRSRSDGSIEFRCPFHAGKVYNSRLGIPKRRKSAKLVKIPKGATKCCNGPCVATPEQLAQFQVPPYGTIAHRDLMAYRNPVEGANGGVRNRHGLQHDTCRAIGLVPHALAAATSAAVRNLQLTLGDELIRRREHRRQKTKRKARNKTQSEEQAPLDGRPAPAEQTSPQTSEAPEDESGTESGSCTLTPPRAPP